MADNLVIVESAAKVSTISRFLGKNYKVEASIGHVRDLPKSQLGVDIENDYEPKYITIRGKGELLQKMRKDVKNAKGIYLATDPDREGEAISWHLYFALKLQEKQALFKALTTFNQCKVLLQIVRFMKCNAECADLTLLEDGATCGKLLIGKNITDIQFAIIHQSPCGLVERIQKV